MKLNKIKLAAVVAAVLLTVATGSFAMDKGGNMGGHDMGKGEKMAGHDMDNMDHSGHMGEMIHESKAGMYQVAYHLIDNMAQMKKMDKKMDMSAHKGMKSNHLMTYFVGHDGKNATGGKVGYLVTGPDGAKQKVMAMEMKGGYGADVDFKAKGRYTVKSKAVFGSDTVMDEFTYEAK